MKFVNIPRRIRGIVKQTRSRCTRAINLGYNHTLRWSNAKKYRNRCYFCPCCDLRVARFENFPYTDGKDRYNQDIYPGFYEETICPHCGSLPRHRIICHQLKQHPDLLQDKKILSFALEPSIAKFLRHRKLAVTTADLFFKADLILDITDIDLGDATYDVVMCNHVLEHVDDHVRALREIHRILTPGSGRLLITVPILETYERTYENPEITSPEDRIKHFGQFDHYKIFGADFADVLAEAGFEVEIICGGDFSPEIRGVVGPANYDSDKFFICTKRPLEESDTSPIS